MIRVTARLSIEENELEESFIRASGPGGQNVNKVSSAVQLRFDVRRSPSLPDAVRARLEKLAGSRLTLDGVLILTAQAHRSQERNRQDARDRLIALIRQATPNQAYPRLEIAPLGGQGGKVDNQKTARSREGRLKSLHPQPNQARDRRKPPRKTSPGNKLQI